MKIPQIRCSDVNAVKRIIFLLVLLIPFCLAGCSSDDDEGDNGCLLYTSDAADD